MQRQVIVIGSGIGGLTAAIRLAQRGCRVTVLESRTDPGGLAAGIEREGFRFDAGPYVLLDRPGLDWAFCRLQLKLAEHVELLPIPDVYQVQRSGRPTVRVFGSLDQTAAAIESQWPRAGTRYRRFITRMQSAYARLQPLQWISRPDLRALWHTGAWREVPLLLRSLRSVLASAQLPDTVTDAMGIWTHVAGQTMARAPSPLAMVPAVIHRIGAFYPAGGIASIPRALYAVATDLPIHFRFATPVAQIRCREGQAVGVETAEGEFCAADAVVSDTGLGTYVNLLDDPGRAVLPAGVHRQLAGLPLQSPGFCAYLAVKGRPEPPYLRFCLRDEPDGCRLMVTPAIVDPTVEQGGWTPARLIAPMQHARAESGGEAAEQAFAERVLAEPWWRERFEDVRVLETRTPSQWGRAFRMYRNSMNPVMTARFMRAGRLAHKSPWIRRLYLAGSATHPGQWVSFAAVSGVLTANRLLQDLESPE